MQRELFPKEAPQLPAAVLALLTPEEVELVQTMPAGRDFGRMLSWVRRNPLIVSAFMKETRTLLEDPPFSRSISVDEILARVRRRHGFKVANHKGFFARWLPRLRPELSARMVRRGSGFDRVMSAWEGNP